MLQLQLWEGGCKWIGERHSRCRPADGVLVGTQTETGTSKYSRPTKLYEAKAKSPIGGGGDAEGTGQMKIQQTQVENGGACENRSNRGGEPLSQQPEKDGSPLPSLAESLSHGEGRRGGAKGPDSAK